VRARAEQNIAISDFHRAIGQLLETWSVVIR
jgi:hypothetical protein